MNLRNCYSYQALSPGGGIASTVPPTSRRGDLQSHDKLSLVLICQKLKEIISNTLLYEELDFCSKNDALLDALEYFESRPIYSSQVQRIQFYKNITTNHDIGRIPVVFPNVREFTSDWSFQGGRSSMYEMLKWKDTLEKCHIVNKDLQIIDLLEKYTFSHLTSLSVVTANTFMIARGTSRILLDKLSLLKNVPLLNDLRLLGGRISFEALEKIHRVCPQLKSLSLSHGTELVQYSDTLPSSILPATSLVYLKLDSETFIENPRCVILDYIIAKYTQLVELELLCQWDNLIKSDNEGNGVYDNPNVNYPDECWIKGDAFLSKLPSTIKKLKFNCHLLNDPLTALEKTGINPTELMFYDHGRRGVFLGEVVQDQHHMDCIKRLGLLKTLGLGFRCSVESLNDNIVFENITYLTIMMVDLKKTCRLDQLFLSYPSLIGLTIHESSSPLAVSGPCTQKTYPNLRKLSIRNELLNHKAIDFVRTALPNIKELDLPIHGYYRNDRRLWCFYKGMYDQCTCNRDLRFDGSKEACCLEDDFSINLSGSMLDVFTLSVTCGHTSKQSNTLLFLEFQTRKGLKKYTIERNSKKRYYIRLTRPDETRQGVNVVKITCDGIKKFMVNDKNVKVLLFDV